MDPRQIQELEQLCVQDEPSWCEAACPLHVEVHAMLAAAARDDFKAGAAVFAKRVPFPGILSRICDRPCLAVCRRGEVDDALQIGLVERSCADYAGFAPETPRPGSTREEQVAVMGGGLSGLTAAVELARRRYAVTLFEASDRLGGRVRLMPAEELPAHVVESELARLEAYPIDIHTDARLGADLDLDGLLDRFAAVYVATGGGTPSGPPDHDGPQITPEEIDPVTLATSRDGVFAGGGLRCPTDSAGAGGNAACEALEGYSPSLSISDGIKAATSIDRYLKGESLSAHREREGPYASRLFTSVTGIEKVPAVRPGKPESGYTREEAASEAGRCLQCRCLECVKACTYLDHYHEYPGKCIRRVTKNITSLPGKSYRTYTPFLNSCSLCGLCRVVCPTDLDMAVVNSEARRVMWDKGFMPPAVHDFAIRDMEASNTGPCGVPLDQPGFSSSSYLFFPGCQLVASAPSHVERVYRFLMDKLSGGVGFSAGCCGAPAAWAGRRALFQEVLDDFTRRWAEMGRPQVILACPTCSLMFKDGIPEVPVVSLWEILDREGLPPGAPPGMDRRLALHDSCTARSAPEIQDSVRRLMHRLGYEIEELPYSRALTKCCGYGGLMSLVNRKVADKVIESRIEESPTDYVTYCSNCRDFFAGKGKVSYHVLDLIFEGHRTGEPARSGPTLSERRSNRHRLAERMLTGIWGGPMLEPREHERVKLRIPPEVAAKMERDFILVEDVQQVIHQAEKTGDKLEVPAKGRFIAHHRPGLITYWVEYAASGAEYEVFNAYSHRMQIVAEEGR